MEALDKEDTFLHQLLCDIDELIALADSYEISEIEKIGCEEPVLADEPMGRRTEPCEFNPICEDTEGAAEAFGDAFPNFDGHDDTEVVPALDLLDMAISK